MDPDPPVGPSAGARRRRRPSRLATNHGIVLDTLAALAVMEPTRASRCSPDPRRRRPFLRRRTFRALKDAALRMRRIGAR